MVGFHSILSLINCFHRSFFSCFAMGRVLMLQVGCESAASRMHTLSRVLTLWVSCELAVNRTLSRQPFVLF